MTTSFYTMDRMTAHLFKTITVKTLISGQCTGIQSGSNRKRFRCRTRFISITYTEIIPNRIQGIQCLIFIHTVDFILRIIRRQIPRIVAVIIRIICHSHDLAVIRILNNNTYMKSSISLGIIIGISIIKFLYFFFYDRLDIGIDRGYNIFAIYRGFYCLFKIRIIIQISVGSSIRSIQNIIIFIFNTADSNISGCCKSQKRTGHRTVRIIANILFFKPDTFDIRLICFLAFCGILICFFFQRLKSRHFIIGDFFLQNNIFTVWIIFDLLSDIRLIKAKTLHQC